MAVRVPKYLGFKILEVVVNIIVWMKEVFIRDVKIIFV
jgi:hypothetical protein